jgi:beta-phosphoglucomutase-like phosphatase (HAD superfamily)
MRFWPQALVFECEVMLLERDASPAKATYGARKFLDELDGKPWGVVTGLASEDAARRLSEADLPTPRVLVPTADLSDGQAFREAAEALGADPLETVAFTATAAALAGAAACGMQIVHPHRLHAHVPGAIQWWIVDLWQMHSDIRAGQWAVTIES